MVIVLVVMVFVVVVAVAVVFDDSGVLQRSSCERKQIAG